MSKYFGSRPAIQDVSFEVAGGEILGFLGPNGAGKTTTMRILAGCLAASAGTARIAGCDVFEQSLEARRLLGYMPEQVPLYPEMRVEEYLNFSASLRMPGASFPSGRFDEVLARCGLVEVRGKLIGRLSRGYRQRVGLAQAILHNPPVLILDEPTVGLDPRQIIEVRELIRDLAGEHTVLLSTHILPEVSMLCTRVVIIDHGRVVAEDTPENLTRAVPGPRPGGERLAIQVEGPAEAVAERLRAVPGVVDVVAADSRLAVPGGGAPVGGPGPGRFQIGDEPAGLSNLEPGTANRERDRREPVSRLVVHTASGDEDVARAVRRAVSRAVVEAGYGLLELSPERLTLEDVFVRLVTTEEA